MADILDDIPGLSVIYNDFLYEFVLKIDDIFFKEFIQKLEEKNIFIGINLLKKFKCMENCILVCVTEMNSIEDIDKAIKEIKNVLENVRQTCQR